MLFSRSTPEQKLQSLVSHKLAALFELTEKQVHPWITIANNNVLISLPFAVASLHEELISAIKLAADEQKLPVAVSYTHLRAHET